MSQENVVRSSKKLSHREKLQQKGPESLTDRELLAVLLGSGTAFRGVQRLSKDLLSLLDTEGASVSYTKLIALSGIGSAQACKILAAREFFRRRERGIGAKLTSPKKVLPLIMHLAYKRQEHVVSILLNGAAEVLSIKVLTIGLLNQTLIHPREVFSSAVEEHASGIIIAHNHPSGEVFPSAEDKKVTYRIAKAGKILGIPLVDHIIFSKKGYYSFKEHGIL